MDNGVMQPSRRSAVPAFEVMTILDTIARMRAEGREVISLCVGEPAQGAPAPVRRALADALAAGLPMGYSETFGLRGLRELIAQHCADWYGLEVDPARIALTTGSSGGFLLAFLAAFDAGDRVAMARPGYPAYRTIAASLGCEVVELDCGPQVRFQPTVELLAAAHAEAPLAGLVIASPANPTGTMIDAVQLAELAAWCRTHGVRLISDEIYHGISYTGSVGECAQRHDPGAVVISSFSKYWAMTGWRLGWMLLPDDLVDPVNALAGNYALCPPVPAMHGAMAAFTPESMAEAQEAVAGHAAARQVLLDRLPDLGWGPVAPSDGAFYLYADIRSRLSPGRTARDWCADLLASTGVAVTPGADFDPVGGSTSVRVSLAAGAEAVAAATARIAAFAD